MHYDDDYFLWQKDMGLFGGMANSPIFAPYLRHDDVLIDLGCGGGYLLNNLQCREKAGIEVNPAARQQAKSLGITVFDCIAAVPDQFATVVISNHVLEHLESPYHALVELKSKIKKNGRLVFVVPHEGPRGFWHPNDINQHLYTWNPMTLGNLFAKAGYRVINVEMLRHRWPRHYFTMHKYLGGRMFQMACKLDAYRLGCNQIRIVAESV